MRAQIMETKTELRAAKVPGSIWYAAPRSDGVVFGISFICPCGCGNESWIHFRQSGDPNGWHWDGNVEAPTVDPSVLQSGMPCQWHGYLRAGEWVPA